MPVEKMVMTRHKGVKQLMAKPQIEEIIPDYLDGDFRKAAMDWVEWLRANKFSVRQSTPGNTDGWRAVYKGKAICGMVFWPYTGKNWSVAPILYHKDEYTELVINRGLQHLFWDNVKYCDGCPPGTGEPRKYKDRPCIGGYNATLFGKEFKGICANNRHTNNPNPDEARVNDIKKLLELEKNARDAVN